MISFFSFNLIAYYVKYSYAIENYSGSRQDVNSIL